VSAMGKAAQPRAYEANGEAIAAGEFVGIACNPAYSVVVEACAGSGKTWLLVARMLRLLLAGAEPSELLAITFTRKAAQEMRERLLQLLRELALLPDEAACELLVERGIERDQIESLLPAARGLYERVLSSSSALAIDTFHSWFGRLIQVAPLASGVPHGYTLTESSGELLAEAYLRLMQSLGEERQNDARPALMRLYETVGDWNTRKMLDAFIAKRTEWWAARQGGSGDPLAWLADLCGEDAVSDARLSLWSDADLVKRLQNIAWLLGQGTKRNRERAVAIETALTEGASLASFANLWTQFFDSNGSTRGNDHRRGTLLEMLEKHLGENAADAFEREFVALAEALLRLQRRSGEAGVLAMNQDLFTVGGVYLEHYQELKAERRLFDFADLEWHAYCLLADDTHAAYIQSRLDARYRHILLDEFQDTNPLQWNIVRAWLDAYGDDAGQPSVFIVGDPKQSIYRFRRAEPRVFSAARDMLTMRGAKVLRTNQTRRNAQAIVDILNAGMQANPNFSAQTTLAAESGQAWRLPLITVAARPGATEQFSLRDPLTTPLEEQEDARRQDEGRAVAAALIAARRAQAENGQTLPWSDVMLLVKKRTHLRAYEKALREAGVPFISDKRGGLLESLEVSDLIALLTFLITPGDNLALAHVLKSPIFGAGDNDLIQLTVREGSSWWQRLQSIAGEGTTSSLCHAAQLLTDWLRVAPQLPVHDLLDLILHQGQVLPRYAQIASPMARSQVLGNIQAFIELSLALDAGRYPSLPKFIDALQALRKGAESDAPDEAAIEAGIDAVRILTIHSAKGLEAPVVVLLDTNHSEAAREDVGILCDWPQEARAPTHFSAFGRKDERGAARDALFADEQGIKDQEDWNLLYVAITRAKRLLIASGIASTRNADADGVIEGSWYARLRHVAEYRVEAERVGETGRQEGEFTLAVFDPPQLPAAAPAERLLLRSEAVDEGVYLHALLERLTQDREWPVAVPETEIIARWLDCPPAVAASIAVQARAILTAPALERFYNPAHYDLAYNELEIAHDGNFLRYDRLVGFDAELWILDYKRQLLDSERGEYQAQLARYRRAAEAVFPDRSLRSALITADGKLWEFSDATAF